MKGGFPCAGAPLRGVWVTWAAGSLSNWAHPPANGFMGCNGRRSSAGACALRWRQAGPDDAETSPKPPFKVVNPACRRVHALRDDMRPAGQPTATATYSSSGPPLMVLETQQKRTASCTSLSSSVAGRLHEASTRIFRNLGPAYSPVAVTARSPGTSSLRFFAPYA